LKICRVRPGKDLLCLDQSRFTGVYLPDTTVSGNLIGVALLNYQLKFNPGKME